jgi:hypothetical protein
MLANLPWRYLQERAEKIPGDKKHVESMLSQSHCVAQFNTAHKLPSSGPLGHGSRLIGKVKIHLYDKRLPYKCKSVRSSMSGNPTTQASGLRGLDSSQCVF